MSSEALRTLHDIVQRHIAARDVTGAIVLVVHRATALGLAMVTNAATAGVNLSTGSFGWDSIGTRCLWVIPPLQAVLVMLMADCSGNVNATHRKIEAVVCNAFA